MGGGVDVKFWTLKRRKGLSKSNKCEHERNNWMPPPWKGVFHQEDQKICQKLQHLFKANLIFLVNTATPDQYNNPWPCPVLLRVIICSPVSFCSWPTEPTLRKHSCTIIQIGRCTQANTETMFANYLHLQTEQLLEECQKVLRKTK